MSQARLQAARHLGGLPSPLRPPLVQPLDQSLLQISQTFLLADSAPCLVHSAYGEDSKDCAQ